MGIGRVTHAGLFVALTTLVACGEGGSDSRTQTMPADVLSESGAIAPPPISIELADLGFDMGQADAPIKIVEFSDFGCGYCRKFHTETLPLIVRDFIEAGHVEWKYVTYVSGMFPNGLPAAFAGECAGEQGAFDAMADLLYRRQGDWKPEGDPKPVFESLVSELGLDLAQYRTCIEEERPRPRIRSGVMVAARLGVKGTPSFLVDGYPLVGAQPMEVWTSILQARLNELASEEATAPGSSL